ncbi:hypothetical protein QTP88_005341 [Uroleucon formosanum]
MALLRYIKNSRKNPGPFVSPRVRKTWGKNSSKSFRANVAVRSIANETHSRFRSIRLVAHGARGSRADTPVTPAGESSFFPVSASFGAAAAPSWHIHYTG